MRNPLTLDRSLWMHAPQVIDKQSNSPVFCHCTWVSCLPTKIKYKKILGRAIGCPKTSKLRSCLFFLEKSILCKIDSVPDSIMRWATLMQLRYLTSILWFIQGLLETWLLCERESSSQLATFVISSDQYLPKFRSHFILCPGVGPWPCAHVGHLEFLLCLSGIENASDIALYSGLGAAVVAVTVLVVGITLYRRSQSDYGVDVIDSSALTGGFQTFKTVRQGQRHRAPQHCVPRTIDYIHARPWCSLVLCEGSSWHWEPLPNCLHSSRFDGGVCLRPWLLWGSMGLDLLLPTFYMRHLI